VVLPSGRSRRTYAAPAFVRSSSTFGPDDHVGRAVSVDVAQAADRRAGASLSAAPS
jgi:hypothetical protein